MTPNRSDKLPYSVLTLMLLTVLAPFAIYFSTVASIVSVWNQSDTFAHGYVILPISLWMIWKRRVTLAKMTPQPGWSALILLFLTGLAWLLADLGEVQVVRQYALAVMIPLTVIVVMGWEIAWSLAFPLAFILLAVPFGEIFIDPLMNFTADFTVMALQLSGIPVLREGTNFSIPTGNWSVVEACSGIRYLISSVTLGCLYAYLTYRSALRRIAFIGLAIVVPIIANGLRAYMIVMIGHLSGMKLAVGVDHLIYGWVFFGLVMFLMFWVGSFWRDDTPGHRAEGTQEPVYASAPVATGKLLMACVGALLCLAIWPVYGSYISRLNINHTAINLEPAQTDWQASPSFAAWRPTFLPATAELDRSFSRETEHGGLIVKYYRNQSKEATVISSMNVIVSQHDKIWLRTDTSYRTIRINHQDVTVRENWIKGPSGKLLSWDWYWIDGQFTSNKYIGKILQTRGNLLLHGDDSAAIIVYAPYNEHPEEARSTLQHFLDANFASIADTLAANKK